ncbi:phytanoyl-CoA dioxygenase family protein [Acidimicrobiaceae bacterium AH-315-P05]|nr:phytanoyl-CoA dioxygenase family protein [Acidimicrobiaceae bacterium AH-315-P05]
MCEALSPNRSVFDHEAGWIQRPGFLSPAEIKARLLVCRGFLGLPSSKGRVGDKPTAGTHHLFELDDRSEFIEPLIGRTWLVEVVAEILGPSFERTQVSYRSPQPSFGGQRLHADDVPMLIPGPNSVATAIVALVPFTELNGATRLVPGSHRRPVLQGRSGALGSHAEQVVLSGDAGTAFVFSGHVLHSGTPNFSAHERPALQLVWRSKP